MTTQLPSINWDQTGYIINYDKNYGCWCNSYENNGLSCPGLRVNFLCNSNTGYFGCKKDGYSNIISNNPQVQSLLQLIDVSLCVAQ